MSGLRQKMERVGEQLLQRPVYVLTSGQVPPQQQIPGAYAGQVTGGDLLYRPIIGDRWRGRGTCIVFDPPSIAWYVRAFCRTAHRAWFRRHTWRVFAHELAHAVPRPPAEHESELGTLRKRALANKSKAKEFDAAQKEWNDLQKQFVELDAKAAKARTPAEENRHLDAMAALDKPREIAGLKLAETRIAKQTYEAATEAGVI